MAPSIDTIWGFVLEGINHLREIEPPCHQPILFSRLHISM